MPGEGVLLEKSVDNLRGPSPSFVAFAARSSDIDFFDVVVTDGQLHV